MRTKFLKLAFAVILSSAALIANAAPTYTFSILESEPNWGMLDLSSYTQLSKPTTAPGSSSSIARAFDINDSGALVGNISPNDGFQDFAALWDNSNAGYRQLQSLGVGTGTGEGSAFSINNLGGIVGYSQNASNVYQATLWSPTSYSPTHLQSLDGVDKAGRAWAINNSGQIVGISYNSTSTDYLINTDEYSRATLWNGTNTPIDLNDYLDQASKNAGWVLNAAHRIDNDGSIYGTAFNRNSSVTEAFLLQSVNPVPEADTSAMLLMGAGLMGFIARRRKNTQA
jgi:probable HAF family extracellular repeat protein